MTISSTCLLKCLVMGAGLFLGTAFAAGPQNPAFPTPPTTIGIPPQQGPLPSPEPTGGLSEKQKSAILKSNFEKMKHDADELASLAKSLQGDLDKSNANVLSLHVVEKAEKIEKLAKKIKGAARGM